MKLILCVVDIIETPRSYVIYLGSGILEPIAQHPQECFKSIVA